MVGNLELVAATEPTSGVVRSVGLVAAEERVGRFSTPVRIRVAPCLVGRIEEISRPHEHSPQIGGVLGVGEEEVVDRREELDIVAELVDLARQEDDVPRVGRDDANPADLAVGDVGQDLVQRQLVNRRAVAGSLRLDDVARRLADVERDRQQFGRPERRGFATAEDPLPVMPGLRESATCEGSR